MTSCSDSPMTAREVAEWCSLALRITADNEIEGLRRAESSLRDLLAHRGLSQLDLAQIMAAAQNIRYMYFDNLSGMFGIRDRSAWCEYLRNEFEGDFGQDELEFGTKPYAACEHVTQLAFDGMYALALSEFRREATADKLGEQFPAEHAAARWLGLASAETIGRIALSESHLHAAGAIDIPPHVIQKLGDVMRRKLRVGRSVDHHVGVLERLVRTCRIWAALAQAGAPTLELTKTLASDRIDAHLSWYASRRFDYSTPPCSCVKAERVAEPSPISRGYYLVPDIPEGNDDRIFVPRCNVLRKTFPSMLHVRDSCLMPYLAWRRRHAAVQMRAKISPQAVQPQRNEVA